MNAFSPPFVGSLFLCVLFVIFDQIDVHSGVGGNTSDSHGNFNLFFPFLLSPRVIIYFISLFVTLVIVS